MKLLSIKLNNIGLYKNEIINFDNKSKNVIFFWGNNGAGKTTLLNSIKIGLFGDKVFPEDYEKYCLFVKENMISSRLSSETKIASIELKIELYEKNFRNEYFIIRSWKINNESFEENVIVNKNGEELDYIEKDEFLNRLQNILPTSLLDVIIFDGEKAIDILNKNMMHKLIKNIIYTVFGMDVYSNLSKDLSLYLRKMNDESDVSNDQIQLFELENKYKTNYSEYITLKNQLEELNKQKNKISIGLSQALKRLADKTGVDYFKAIDVKKTLSSMEDENKNLMDEIKHINDEILPLKMLHKKIKNIIKQIDIEKPLLVINNLKTIEKYFANDNESLKLINELEEKINQKDSTSILYNLSELESDYICKINNILDSYSKEKLLSYYKNRNDVFSSLKEQMELNEKISNKQNKDLILKIQNDISIAQDLQSNINALEKDFSGKEEEMNNAKMEYETYKKTLLLKKKQSNSYLSVLAYRDAIDEFIEKNINDICNKLKNNLLSELIRIKFRNGSISNVNINNKTFEINVYEKGDKIISPKLLSAGEKQILLGLVIKESLKISKIDTFFLFDTPVGRLDKGNRAIFTKEVIMKVSDQVAVFATDSDYSKEDYEYICEDISQELRLVRNVDDQIVAIKGSIYEGAIEYGD